MRVLLIFLMVLSLASCGTLPVEETADVIESVEPLENLSEASETVIEENPNTDPEEAMDYSAEAADENQEEIKSEPDFARYTDNYYVKIADINLSDFYASNPILDGRTVDFEKAVKIYFIDDKYDGLKEETQIIAFLID